MCSKSQGFYGEPAKVRESEVEDYLVKCVKKLGGEVRKVKWIGRRGAPDRVVMVCGLNFFVELKAPGKKPNEQQQREIESLKSRDVAVYVVDSINAVDQLLSTIVWVTGNIK